MVIENTFRQKLIAGKPTIGTHFMFNDPDIPEMIGDSGFFDYGEFAAEYASFDMDRLYHVARSAQCGALPLMIKPDQESQGFWSQAALGAGFKAVLFTDIRSAADVEECHRLIRPDFPDIHGSMGVKLRRPALQNYDIDQYAEELKNIVFAIMIEKNAAYENLDEILEKAKDMDVDMTQWGPADFGFSRGNPKMGSTDSIRPFEETVIKKSLEYGISPRIEIGSTEQAARYIDLGVRHFCVGWDRFIYASALKQLGEGMARIMESIS